MQGRRLQRKEGPGEDNEKPLKRSKSDEVAEALKEGLSLREVDEMLPGYFLQNQKKILEYQAFVQAFKTRQLLKPLVSIQYLGDQPETEVIVNWLNLNLFQPRAHKQQQLYIWGPPNSRKTSLITLLRDHLAVYDVPHDAYCSGYQDESYDLAVIDEYTGPSHKGKDQSFINQFLEGSIFALPNRYAPLMKRKNLPVIILSNWPVGGIHVRTEVKAQMNARVYEVEIKEDSPIDLDNVLMVTENAEL